ncbi:hypothetical protein RJT34_29831 [Clitoria ternatea]|uniref:HMA domain-containing protein n=1 Tax=Clitoria ternatea TaxID=43366 RepID=A0AAN9ETE9_CLITE
MGAKKKTNSGENNNNKENEDSNATTVVLKVDMHCDGCASKIIRHLRAFQGVETVKVDSDAGKLTVTGKLNPSKVRESLAEKINKKVELVSPQPKKEKEKEKEKENKDTRTNNNKQSENKTHDKKTKDKEVVVTTVVLKMALHCQGCLDRIGKIVQKTKGVQEMSIDKEKETVTVKGTMDVEALVGNLMEKLKRKVEVVPPKKDKEGDNEGEGKKKKKNKGGNNGGGDSNENGEKMEQSRMEYLGPSFGFTYGYGHGYNNYNYVQVPIYPEQMHFYMHAPPPQMFSDENPNACSVM